MSHGELARSAPSATIVVDMNSPRRLKDDALFLGALVAILAGTGLLFQTTGFMPLPEWAGPFCVMGIGGILLYVTLVRGRSAVFFGAGSFLVFAGIVLLLGSPRQVWPLFLAAAGLAWLAFGLWRYRRVRASSLVPSIIMFGLGLFFSLFSLGIVTMRLSSFLAIWWPGLIILGGIALFIAWSLNVPRAKGRKRPANP